MAFSDIAIAADGVISKRHLCHVDNDKYYQQGYEPWGNSNF